MAEPPKPIDPLDPLVWPDDKSNDLTAAHYAAIGRVAAEWAALETVIDSASLRLAQIEPRIGVCLTSQIAGWSRKLDAYIALARLYGATSVIISKLNAFANEQTALPSSAIGSFVIRGLGRPNHIGLRPPQGRGFEPAGAARRSLPRDDAGASPCGPADGRMPPRLRAAEPTPPDASRPVEEIVETCGQRRALAVGELPAMPPYSRSTVGPPQRKVFVS
jgi:hypothetical protein